MRGSLNCRPSGAVTDHPHAAGRATSAYSWEHRSRRGAGTRQHGRRIADLRRHNSCGLQAVGADRARRGGGATRRASRRCRQPDGNRRLSGRQASVPRWHHSGQARVEAETVTGIRIRDDPRRGHHGAGDGQGFQEICVHRRLGIRPLHQWQAGRRGPAPHLLRLPRRPRQEPRLRLHPACALSGQEPTVSKIWFISGSSRGLGRAITEAALAAGTGWLPLPGISVRSNRCGNALGKDCGSQRST